MLGGLACKMIARNQTTVIVFAVVVLILGFAEVAYLAATVDYGTPPVRDGATTMSEAAQKSQQHTPMWAALLRPLVGAGGILLGARLKR